MGAVASRSGQRRRVGRCLAPLAWLAALVLAVLASVAQAGDYTVSNVSGRFETKPSGAKNMTLNPSTGEHAFGAWFDLPFAFPYYGASVERIWVGHHGGLVIGNANPYINADNIGFPQSGQQDGLCAPLWDRQYDGYPWAWTDGTAPDRRVIVSWDDCEVGAASSNVIVSFQVQLHESGRIVFAYKRPPTGNFSSYASYTCGIDSPVDTRYIRTASPGGALFPADDYQFDPDVVTVSGVAQYDHLPATADGLGTEPDGVRPAAGLRVELRTTSWVAAIGRAAADGSFALRAAAVAPGTTASVWLVADTDSVVVRTADAAAPTAWVASSSLQIAADADAGTLTLGAALDAAGQGRAALETARVLSGVRAWCLPRVADAIPKLEVRWNAASAATTWYTPGATPKLVVGSLASGNEDAWDAAVLTRAYAAHVLQSVSSRPAIASPVGFGDSVTATVAFADAFGYALWTAVSGETDFVDAIDATHGTSLDLESPPATYTRSPGVPAWIAATLCDTVDAADEVHDRVDGTAAGAADRFLRVVDAAAEPLTIADFHDAWVAAGHDPVPLTRLYLAHGFLTDDAAEHDDDAGEAKALALGTRRSGAVLNRYNEDWYAVQLAAPAESLRADADFQRTAVAADLALSVRDAQGNVLASAATQPGFAPVRCATAPVPAGTYFVRVAHTSGERIPSYSVQVHEPLRIDASAVVPWTVGRSYSRDVVVAGGVAPLVVRAVDPLALPPGVGVTPSPGRVAGVPSAAGSWLPSLEVEDSGTPRNVVATTVSMRMNPPLALRLGAWAAFALDRAPLTGPFVTGGTDTVASVTSGRLPAGIVLLGDGLAFEGAASAVESVRFGIDATEAAGSSAHAEPRGVVCVPSFAGRADCTLPEGDAGCGFWFDAVAGSTVSAAFAPARKQPKRTFGGELLSVDGATPVAGGKRAAKAGKWSVAGAVLPASGRYYVVAASAAGPATVLAATVKIAPPRAGKATTPVVGAGARVRVEFGALAGASVSFAADPAKKKGARVELEALLDPAGRVVPLSGLKLTTTKTGGLRLSAPLPIGGTWTAVLVVRDADAAVKWSHKLKQPRKGTYAAD